MIEEKLKQIEKLAAEIREFLYNKPVEDLYANPLNWLNGHTVELVNPIFPLSVGNRYEVVNVMKATWYDHNNNIDKDVIWVRLRTETGCTYMVLSENLKHVSPF